MTIKDYLKYYKNISFKESIFNEVDNIFFSELAYLHWDNIVTKKINLNEAINIYLNSNVKEINNKFIKGIVDNLKTVANGTRYKNCSLEYYIKDVKENKQFGALTIHIDNKTTYVAFEGTDNTISGWKENFMMSYLFPTESQQHAIEYINKVIKYNDQIIYVGGHSKGGNLAIVASMYARKGIQNRIKTIYSNDGQGVIKKIFESPEYKRIENKIKLFVPSESIVGELLYNPPIYKVIEANGFNISEHDCNNWKCFGPYFIESKLTKASSNINIKTKNWLEEVSDDKKRVVVENIFKVIDEAEIKKLEDIKKINPQVIKNAINSIKYMDADTKKLIINSIKKLILK